MRIPDKVRYLNKKLLNRLMIRIAGKKHSPIALLHHKGRISGKEYETPIMVARCQDGFMFALTYGWNVDWYRNLKTFGKGCLVWKGAEYCLSDPKKMDPIIGRKAFGQPQTTILGWLKIEDFAYMHSKLITSNPGQLKSETAN